MQVDVLLDLFILDVCVIFLHVCLHSMFLLGIPRGWNKAADFLDPELWRDVSWMLRMLLDSLQKQHMLSVHLTDGTCPIPMHVCLRVFN